MRSANVSEQAFVLIVVVVTLYLIFASLSFFCQTLFSPHDHYFQIVLGRGTS